MNTYTTPTSAKAAASQNYKAQAIAHVQLDNGDDAYVVLCAVVPVEFFVTHKVPGVAKAYSVTKYNRELTDAQKACREINKWQDKADAADSAEAKIRAERKVEQLEAEYYAKYPEKAKAARKASMMATAAHLRDAAKQALVFDADGSLYEGARQERHDEMIAKAEKLEAEAAMM